MNFQQMTREKSDSIGLSTFKHVHPFCHSVSDHFRPFFLPTIIVVKSILHLKSTCLKSQMLSLKENHTSEDLTDGLDLL